MSIENSISIKHVPPALAGPVVSFFFIETYKNFGSTSFFNVYFFRVSYAYVISQVYINVSD